MKIKLLKRLKRSAYSSVDLIIVAGILATVPIKQFKVVEDKAVQTKCINRLVNVGRMMKAHVISNDVYPNAVFFPKNPRKDPNSLPVILGGRTETWVCPALPQKLQDLGLTFVYNDALAGKPEPRVPDKTWVLIEMSCVSKKCKHPHPGGFNVLFADGHVATHKKLPPGITKHQRAMIEQLMLDQYDAAEMLASNE